MSDELHVDTQRRRAASGPLPHSEPPDPLFVGGTGRSGTHALARLLGQHARYFYIPLEAKFHALDTGFPGLFAGTVTLERFLKKMRGPWWRRQAPDGSYRGLHRLIEEEPYNAAVNEFEASFASDPVAAAAGLMRSLIDPQAAARGAAVWVEKTTFNVAAAPLLLRLFPDMKVIHIARDGRDSAASMVQQHWGPDGMKEALKLWEERMQRAERGGADIPPDRLLTLSLEDLVARDREGSYSRILAFVEENDDERMRAYYESETKPDRANIGRWRTGLSERQQRKVNRRYAKALERLAALGTPGQWLFERSLSEIKDPSPAT